MSVGNLANSPKKVAKICAQCGATTYRWPSAAKRAGNFFCSRACVNQANKTGFDMKAWQAANREHLNERSREWCRQNRDLRLQVQARYRATHREYISLLCTLRRSNGRPQASPRYLKGNYKPSEVGSGIYAEKLAALADAYPEWAEQVEDEG